MTDKLDTEETEGREHEPRQRFRHSRRVGLVRSLMINIALIAMPLLVYFVVVVEHSSAYADQRSLRALQEIATQIDNRMDTLENILRYTPDEMQRWIASKSSWDPDCSKHGNNPITEDCLKKLASEIPKVTGQKFSVEPICPGDSEECRERGMSTADKVCLQPKGADSDVRLIVGEGYSPGLRLVDCKVKSQFYVIRDKSAMPASFRPVIDTKFSEIIGNTQALTELPLIIVASQRGEVYAQLIRDHSKDPNPPAHEEVREEPAATNLQEILVAAEKDTVSELLGKDRGGNSVTPNNGDNSLAAGDQKAGEGQGAHDTPMEAKQLGLPVALDMHLAGTPYRAYVLPYPLDVPVCKETGTASNGNGSADPCTKVGTIIYLVGLRRSGLVARATASLSPVLLLGALLALIAACLLWPFLRQALLEPNDAVTWRQVRVLCVAFLVLAALGALTSRALVLGHFMYERMDHALEVIADEIDEQLRNRIATELKVLQGIESQWPANQSSDTCKVDGQETITLPRNKAPKAYPIVEQYFQTDKSGAVKEDSWIYYALTGEWRRACGKIDVSERQYFTLLRDEHGVDKGPWKGAPLILQRLFNKTDGNKILQLAVARPYESDRFQGISSVNIGTIEVTSPVLPLGIGYAIFERSTGTVVFHSDDSRSLVENFYAETEHNPTLSSAVHSETAIGTPFSGRYRGARKIFFYKPMTYSPWGLVVFYDSSGVAAVLVLSVVSALSATVVTLFGGLALAHVAIWLVRRRHSWLWPQWRLRDAYPTVSIYLAVVSICEFQILRHAQSNAWQVAVLFTVPLFVLTACFSVLSARTPEISTRRLLFFRDGPSLVQWSWMLHSVLLISWALAAGAAGEYWASLVLVLAFLVWVTLLARSAELRPGLTTAKPCNKNPWRRDLSLWPGSVMPATGRASYRMRYLLFTISLALVVSVVPTLAIFDRTFEWYLSSALNLAHTDTDAQWEARVQKMKEDMRELGHSPPFNIREEAAKLLGFGVTFVDAKTFDVDGNSLFRSESPTSCFQPPVAWPLGVWERKMHWDEGLFERLRQEAMALEVSGPAQPGCTDGRMEGGVRGTIHELLHAGGMSFTSILWDIVAGLAILASLVLLLNFSAQHVTGISLPWSGRFGRQIAPGSSPEGASDEGAPIEPRQILLLQPNEESLDYLRKQASARGGIREVDAASDCLNGIKPDRGKVTTWLLYRVEIAVLDENRRAALLGLLETLAANPNARAVAIGDVSPVYRIARPQAYPGPSWPRIDDYERLRWIDLFAHFHKFYSARDMKAVFERTNSGAGIQGTQGNSRIRNLEELIDRETRALWPCLRPVRDILLDRLHAGEGLTDRDVIELVALHGEVHYRKAWEYCTRGERLALYQLAQGKLINMSNHRVIEHLLRRGLVVFEPEPRIKSVSLREFILNAELPGRMESWAAEAAEGLWQSVRVPFFVALMLVVAWIGYSSGDAFQAVVALIATSVAVIGQALRLLGMAGFSTSTKDK